MRGSIANAFYERRKERSMRRSIANACTVSSSFCCSSSEVIISGFFLIGLFNLFFRETQQSAVRSVWGAGEEFMMLVWKTSPAPLLLL
jgi:hypothetical protein